MNIKKIYKEIFKSYGDLSIEKHIKKIIELDTYLPYSSTFFCVTNTQDLTFEYVSKSMFSCVGIEKSEFKKGGMKYFWSRIHPDDIELWLKALNELMSFTMSEISSEDKKDMTYTWNFRFKKANNEYVNIIQNTTPLEFDADDKPIIGLAHYTVLDSKINMPICASAKLLNKNNEYETMYFNNFSQKLLENNTSNREKDVIRLLVLGHTSKEISKKLFISPNTVDTHRRNILKKLNISSTGELVAMIKLNKHLI